jgi:hypothetical protein
MERTCYQSSGEDRQVSRPNFVIGCFSPPLFVTQVTLSCLDTDISQQELDLLKLAAGLVAK